MRRISFVELWLLTLCLVFSFDLAQAQTNEFTYQGKLTASGTPPTAPYDFEFRLCASESSCEGATFLQTVLRIGVPVSGGIFTVQLDFDPAHFDGADRFLEIRVRQTSADPWTPLLPRQKITSSPYSIKSLNAASADLLSSACELCVTDNNILSISGGKVAGPVSNAINANFATSANNSSQLGGLPANFYPLLNNTGTQTFTGNNTFSGNVLYTGTVSFQTNIGAFGISADAAAFNGQVQINSLGSAGSTVLCRNSSNQISSCSPFYVDLSSNQSISGYKFFTTGVAGNGAGLTNLNGAAINQETNITANVITGNQIFANQNITALSGITAGNSRFTGTVQIDSLGSAGSNTLCRNASNLIATCSSSLRYKTNIAPFSFGLSFIKQLRPIIFDWKQGGFRDVGFGAEEIARISPLFVTYNEKGEVEGVKYDRLSVVFVNALTEQQEQIERQQKMVESLQQQIEALKLIVCELKPEATICKEEQK